MIQINQEARRLRMKISMIFTATVMDVSAPWLCHGHGSIVAHNTMSGGHEHYPYPLPISLSNTRFGIDSPAIHLRVKSSFFPGMRRIPWSPVTASGLSDLNARVHTFYSLPGPRFNVPKLSVTLHDGVLHQATRGTRLLGPDDYLGDLLVHPL